MNTEIASVHLIDVGNGEYITSVVVDYKTFHDIWYELGKLPLITEYGAPYDRHRLEELKKDGIIPKLMRTKELEPIYQMLEKLSGEKIITTLLTGALRE